MSERKPSKKDIKTFCRLAMLLDSQPDAKFTADERTLFRRMIGFARKEYERTMREAGLAY